MARRRQTCRRKAPAYNAASRHTAYLGRLLYRLKRRGCLVERPILTGIQILLALVPVRTSSGKRTSGRLKTSGFTGGGQIGYNNQFDSLVFGIEADLQYTGLSGTRAGAVFIPPAGCPNVDTFTQSMESKWLGTLRGRLGVAFGSLLPYATGGLAIARVSYSDFGFFPFLPVERTPHPQERRARAGPLEEAPNGSLLRVGASRPSTFMWTWERPLTPV